MIPLVTPRIDPQEIASRIRRAREAKNLTQEALATTVGMETDTYRKKENGENPLFLADISRICDALGAPSLFPWMEWGEAKLADRLLGRVTD